MLSFLGQKGPIESYSSFFQNHASPKPPPFYFSDSKNHSKVMALYGESQSRKKSLSKSEAAISEEEKETLGRLFYDTLALYPNETIVSGTYSSIGQIYGREDFGLTAIQIAPPQKKLREQINFAFILKNKARSARSFTEAYQYAQKALIPIKEAEDGGHSFESYRKMRSYLRAFTHAFQEPHFATGRAALKEAEQESNPARARVLHEVARALICSNQATMILTPVVDKKIEDQESRLNSQSTANESDHSDHLVKSMLESPSFENAVKGNRRLAEIYLDRTLQTSDIAGRILLCTSTKRCLEAADSLALKHRQAPLSQSERNAFLDKANRALSTAQSSIPQGPGLRNSEQAGQRSDLEPYRLALRELLKSPALQNRNSSATSSSSFSAAPPEANRFQQRPYNWQPHVQPQTFEAAHGFSHTKGLWGDPAPFFPASVREREIPQSDFTEMLKDTQDLHSNNPDEAEQKYTWISNQLTLVPLSAPWRKTIEELIETQRQHLMTVRASASAP